MDIEIISCYEVLPDNNVRFGIKVINHSEYAISDAEILLDYTESLFQLEGTKVKNLGNIPPNIPRTAEFILKPLGLIQKENIGATIIYKDYQWKKHTLEMDPKEVHYVYPFLKEKSIKRSDFLTLSKSGYLEERGLNFEGITVDKLVEFLLHTCRNRLYKVDEFSIEKGKIIYLSGDAIGEEAYYLLTAVVKEYEDFTQVLLRANSDKEIGLIGFLNEIFDNLRHLMVSASVREIGVIKKEQVINIIDSVVQRTTFGGYEGGASVNIKDSEVQRTELKGDVERKRREEERRRKEREELQPLQIEVVDESGYPVRNICIRVKEASSGIDVKESPAETDFNGIAKFIILRNKQYLVAVSTTLGEYINPGNIPIRNTETAKRIQLKRQREGREQIIREKEEKISEEVTKTSRNKFIAIALVLGLLALGYWALAPGATDIPTQASIQKAIDSMEFVLIPAGEFDMGSPSNKAGWSDAESPVHHVKISNAFYMGKYEVTQKQWREVMGNDISYFKGDNLPVESASWNDVQDFIKKLNERKDGNKYRLPTEAEWEYAARAMTTTRYSFGDDESKLGDYAWYIDNSGDETHDVGKKKPNPWGLYDMYGNVWEWMQDKWHVDYNGAPTDGSSWESGNELSRVVRGCVWFYGSGGCGSASRFSFEPVSRGYYGVGFRLVMETNTNISHTPGITPAISVLSSGADQNNITNSIGMEFILIPAGEFNMGSPSNEAGRDDDEGPVHHVKIPTAFYMGKYEVTQKQWRDVMGNDPSYFKGDDLPVEQVSWNDVQDFIKKLNEKEGGKKYRLPSEAEWEYAVHAGTTTRYSFGDEESKLGEYAWYDANSGSKTHDVGQKKPNPWGLYDMHGNVWEWVQDSWHDNYNGAPIDGGAWSGDGLIRQDRGGGWDGYAKGYRSADRGYITSVEHYGHLGFRLLRIS